MEKNIEMAIAAEEKYIQLKGERRLNGNSIYDFLAPYGYTDLKNFRDDKTLFLFHGLDTKVVEVTSEEIEKDAGGAFIKYYNEHKPYILYNITLNRDTAILPLSCNKNYDGFLTVKPGYDCDPERGNILTFDGDLEIVMLLPTSVADIYKWITKEIANYLSRNTKKIVIIDNNDILVDGKKVCGSASAIEGDYSIAMFHISFSNNDEAVKKLCPKSEKTPGHIDFMDAKQLFNHITSWLL